MADFEIEKNVHIRSSWRLNEAAKNALEQLEINDSFSFPIEQYLPIKRLAERKRKEWNRKYSLRRVSYDKGRIWRTA